MQKLKKNCAIKPFLVFVFLFLGVAQAQVSLSPLYSKLILEPTGLSQDTFTITNGSSEAARFRATFSNFAFEGVNINLAFKDANTDLSPYLRAAPLEFVVPAFSEQTLRVIALIPPSVLKQELRAALVLEPLYDQEPSEESDSGSVSGRLLFKYRFVAQIFLSPSGLPDMYIDKVAWTARKTIQLKAGNRGTNSGVVNVTWRLNRGDKQIAASQSSSRFVVLTEGKRTTNLIEGLDLQPGEYTLTGTFGTEDGGEPPVVLNPQPFTKIFTVK